MDGIGTLNEKSIHSTLKNYLESDKQYHEIKVGCYIADIKRDNKIYEIQTSNFKKLVSKIEYYTAEKYDVTVIYPIIETKYIKYIDDNRVVRQRKSNIHGVVQDVLKELYWIIDYLGNGITLKLIFIDSNEYRYISESKRKTIKLDSKPISINKEIEIKSKSDLIVMIPDILMDKEWTSKDYLKYSKCNKKWLGSNLKLMRDYGIIKVVRKDRNKYVYRINIEN